MGELEQRMARQRESAAAMQRNADADHRAGQRLIDEFVAVLVKHGIRPIDIYLRPPNTTRLDLLGQGWPLGEVRWGHETEDFLIPGQGTVRARMNEFGHEFDPRRSYAVTYEPPLSYYAGFANAADRLAKRANELIANRY